MDSARRRQRLGEPRKAAHLGWERAQTPTKMEVKVKEGVWVAPSNSDGRKVCGSRPAILTGILCDVPLQHTGELLLAVALGFPRRSVLY